MIKLKIDGSEVTYDTLDEARDAAAKSGHDAGFWRETLSECAENEAMWNEFLNDLWQSGAEDEAERLDRTFPKDAPCHWLLVALTLDGDDPWEAFLAEWNAQGDDRILPAVSSPAFASWLKQVQPKKYDLLVRAFGADVAKWPNDLLLEALKSRGTAEEVARLAAMRTVKNVGQAVKDFRSGVEKVLKDSFSRFKFEIVGDEIVESRSILNKMNEPDPGEEMTITLPGDVPMTFCWCPATTSEAWKKISGGDEFFWMGSPESEACRSDGETRHRVRLTQGFWMGKYEVTQRQWEGVMGKNPSHFRGADRPVEQVSWNDCQEFVGKINAAGQIRASLPTEAQWEYACRAGTTTPFSFGSTLNGDKANCNGSYNSYGMSNGRYRQETSPVGEYEPNAWGLSDMHGNVWEWCQDWYGNYSGNATDPTGPASGASRALRGGCWCDYAEGCRSAFRHKGESGFRGYAIALRLVCSRAAAAQLGICPR